MREAGPPCPMRMIRAGAHKGFYRPAYCVAIRFLQERPSPQSEGIVSALLRHWLSQRGRTERSRRTHSGGFAWPCRMGANGRLVVLGLFPVIQKGYFRNIHKFSPNSEITRLSFCEYGFPLRPGGIRDSNPEFTNAKAPVKGKRRSS